MNLQNNKLKNFTPLPNEIFSLHLSTGELATYAVLMRLEDPRTYECWPSYETIGKAIGKSKSSVKRYVAGLVEKGLITVEPTSVIMRNGLKKTATCVITFAPSERRWNGTPSISCTSPKPPPSDNGCSDGWRHRPRNRRVRPGEPLCGLLRRGQRSWPRWGISSRFRANFRGLPRLCGGRRKKREKGIGAFLRRCHLQHPAVQAATRDWGVVKMALFSETPEPFDAKFEKSPHKVPCHKALRRRCDKYGNDFNCRILRTNID